MNSITTVAAVSVILLAGYAYRADFARYSIFTVGVFKRIRRYSASPDEFECADPMCETTGGEDIEQRRYYKEIVVAGMPVVRYGGGTSYYCEDHHSFEYLQQEHEEASRISQDVVEAIVEFIAWLEDDSVGLAGMEDSEFDDAVDATVQTAGSAMSLLTIAIVVGIATVMMNYTSSVAGGDG